VKALHKRGDKNKIIWLYECKTFDLGDTTYTPDFYLPKTDMFVEIKGFWRPEAKEKFKLFKKLYPYIKIKVIEDIKSLGD
jgi:predicted nuclease of restriction endonuclease-like RecB superfamily